MVIRKLNENAVLVQLYNAELNLMGLKHKDFNQATDKAKEFIDNVLIRVEEEKILEDLKKHPIKLSVCADERIGIRVLIEKMTSDDLNEGVDNLSEDLSIPSEFKEFLERLVNGSKQNQENNEGFSKHSKEKDLKEDLESKSKSEIKSNTKNRECSDELAYMYCFNSLDDVIKASSKIYTILGEDVNLICDSKLFKHTGKYYMVLSFENVKRSDLNLILSGVVTEFGGEEETRNKDILIDFMNEHAEVIVKSDVIGKLGNL